MKKVTLLSLMLVMSLSLLFANSWYYDLGGGHVLGQTLHVSQRIGYQITTEPSLYLTFETAFEGDHKKEVFVLASRWQGGQHWIKRNERHVSFFLAPGVMYYPMPRWQVSASMGIESADTDFALKLSTAYDLSSTRHGFQVGLQYFWANCGSVQSATLGMFLKYRYKGSNNERERRERPARETIRHW